MKFINDDNFQVERPHDINMVNWIPWTKYIDEEYGQKNYFKFLNFTQKRIAIALVIAIFCFII